MHVTTFNTPAGPRSVVAHADGSPADPAAVRQLLAPLGSSVAEPGNDADGAVLAPLRPGNIVAVGLNYADHVRETGMTAPERPLVFAKFPSCVIGPTIVTRDEIPDPQRLGLTTTVNGEVLQDSSTSEMVFGVSQLLAFCSRSFTLEPGDLLLTGTPSGCGEFMEPKRSLQEGDVVECAVESVGALRNPVEEVRNGR